MEHNLTQHLSQLSQQQQKELLRQARQVIAKGCSRSLPPEPDHNNQPAVFLQHGACFVTLHKHGELRGCIGSIEAHRPLLDDVMHHAFASAFRDHRFPPVQQTELADLHIEISILTPKQKMQVASEAELLRNLRPNIDGLLIQSSLYTATFLPQVWEQLPEPELFLTHLKQKAGMPSNEWPEDIACYKYQCNYFHE